MKVVVKFSENSQVFNAILNESSDNFSANVGEVQVVTKLIGGEVYEGEYAVTPKVEAQTMPTKEKVMRDDVTIRAIPVFRVSNTSGGTTVYIAKEV